jgi:3-hydroxyisobutyrate dehydrogenase-like beta-hydroxyacid dehydrogenase
MNERTTVGFIGLGVMGRPICQNIARKSGAKMVAYDVNPTPLQRLAAEGVEAASSVLDVTASAEIIFLSLPGGPQVQAVVTGAGGVLAAARGGKSLSTFRLRRST